MQTTYRLSTRELESIKKQTEICRQLTHKFPDMVDLLEIVERADEFIANQERRASLELCEGCGEEIDPATCYCGEEIDGSAHDNHYPVPMGCACHRIDPNLP